MKCPYRKRVTKSNIYGISGTVILKTVKKVEYEDCYQKECVAYNMNNAACRCERNRREQHE